MPSSTAAIIARARLGEAGAREPQPRDMDWRPEPDKRDPSSGKVPDAPERTPRETGLRWVFARLRLGRT
jgi:hypothetical protein